MLDGRLTLGVAGTFPPREDGIATFTRDLLGAVIGADAGITAHVAAITEPGARYAYPAQVACEIEQNDKARLRWSSGHCPRCRNGIPTCST